MTPGAVMSDNVGIGHIPGALPRELRLDGYAQCLYCSNVWRLPALGECPMCRGQRKPDAGAHRGHRICADCFTIYRLIATGREDEALEQFGRIPQGLQDKLYLEREARASRLTYMEKPTETIGDEDDPQGVVSG